MLVLFNQVMGGVDILSGGEKITVELLRRWKKYQEVTVIMPENGLDLIRTKEHLDVKYITLPLTLLDKHRLYWKYNLAIPLIWFIHTVMATIKILRINIDKKCLFSSGDFFCNIIPAFLLKIRDKKINWMVLIFHIIESPFKRKGGNSFLSNLTSYLLQRFSFCFIRSKADKVLVLNEDLKNQLVTDGFAVKRLFVSGAGVNLNEIESVLSPEDKIYDACFMARLSPTKGVLDIPLIWREVIKEKKNSKLLIIGGGTEKEERTMHSSIIQSNISGQIEMAGFKTGIEKYRLMKSCKIFIFPSYEEGFALSILEAMACRLPVVAWDLPAFKAVYEDTIITALKGNLKLFARAIISLLANEKMRQDYAEKGYHFAKRYDWDIVAKRAYEGINN